MEKKRGEGNKDFKKGGKLSPGVGTLKGGRGTPYELCPQFSHSISSF